MPGAKRPYVVTDPERIHASRRENILLDAPLEEDGETL
jgi:hypothetical protein